MSSLTLFTNPNLLSPLSGKGILYLHWWNLPPVASWHGATAGSGIRLLLPPCLLSDTGGLMLEKRTWSPCLILSFFNSGSWAMIWLSFKSAFTIQSTVTHPSLPYEPPSLSITLSLNHQRLSPSVASSSANDSIHWFLFNDIKTILCHFSQRCLLTLLNDILKARGYHLPVLYQQLISPSQVLSVLSTCILVTISLFIMPPFSWMLIVHSWWFSLAWNLGPDSCSITGNCYSTVNMTFLTWMDQTFLAGSSP